MVLCDCPVFFCRQGNASQMGRYEPMQWVNIKGGWYNILLNQNGKTLQIAKAGRQNTREYNRRSCRLPAFVFASFGTIIGRVNLSATVQRAVAQGNHEFPDGPGKLVGLVGKVGC